MGNSSPSSLSSFPAAWGDAPAGTDSDGAPVELPGGFGDGPAALAAWVQGHLGEDNAAADAASAAAVAEAAAAAGGGQWVAPLRVLTYNVNWGFNRTRASSGATRASRQATRVRRSLLDADADIVCLQETHAGWEAVLVGGSSGGGSSAGPRSGAARELAARYPHRAWRHPQPADGTGAPFGPSGSAVLSKWPIRRQSVLHASAAAAATTTADACGSDGDSDGNGAAGGSAPGAAVAGSIFPAMLVTVDVPGLAAQAGSAPREPLRIRILNVHLRPSIDAGLPPPGAGRGTKAAWYARSVGAYFSTPAVRLAELRRYVGELRARRRQLPLLVAGDFNENEGGAGMRWLGRPGAEGGAGMSSAVAPFDARSPTWRWPLPLGSGYTTDRYDHIMHTPEFACAHGRIHQLDRGASDHFPVIADLVLSVAASSGQPNKE